MSRADDHGAGGTLIFAERLGIDVVPTRIHAPEICQVNRLVRMRELVFPQCQQTLTPIDIAVREVSPALRRTANPFVEVGDALRIDAQ